MEIHLTQPGYHSSGACPQPRAGLQCSDAAPDIDIPDLTAHHPGGPPWCIHLKRRRSAST